MARSSLTAKKVHKQKHLRGGGPLAMCGRWGNIPNHSNWDKVTCKNCLKTRKDK